MQHEPSPALPGGGEGALRATPPPARQREAEPGRNAGTLWTERRSRMNATRIAKALGERAEEVCRAYLPHGRRQGRYWTAGDIRGARGRSLFVRLAPPGVPGKWTDSAEGIHGDLLDLIRHRMGGVPLRDAMAEARAFLALPAAPAAGSADTYDPSEAARRLWQRCRAIDGTHAEAYLRARAIHRCRFSALRFHPSLFYRDGSGVRRLPALVAAVTVNAAERPSHAAIVGVHRTWLDPRQPAKAAVSFPRKTLGRVHGHAVRFGDTGAGTLLVGEGIETVLSMVTAVPAITAAAALSAGGLGAFTRHPQLGGREDANPLIFLDRNIKGRHYRAPNGGGGSSAVRRRSAARAVAAGSCRAGAAVARAPCSAGCGAAGRGDGHRWSADGRPPSGWWRRPR